MQLMSFALTEPQLMRDVDPKDVTRRLGWRRLRPGQRVQAVRKSMGLRPGEQVYRLCVIEIVSVRREALDAIEANPEDCAREGFRHLTPGQFVQMFCVHMKCRAAEPVTRIEFRRLFKNADPFVAIPRNQ